MFNWLRRGSTGSVPNRTSAVQAASERVALLYDLEARLSKLEEQNSGYRLEMAGLVSQAEEILDRSAKGRDRAEASERRQAAKADNGARPGGDRPWESDPEAYRRWLVDGRPE